MNVFPLKDFNREPEKEEGERYGKRGGLTSP
jgi:hypothetical protein